MELSLSYPALDAFRAGVQTYQPICPGLTLEPETGDPDVTARNLHAIFFSSPKRAILSVIASGQPEWPVLIVLKTGETYLASGFRLASEHLARFLVEHNDGDWREDFEEMHGQLKDLPADMAGPVHIRPAV